jgi:chlorobactene glucosyltransferase
LANVLRAISPGTVYQLLVLAVLGFFAGMLARNVRTLRRLEDEHPLSDCDLPTISILIPARNEEQNLPRCLESLVGQRYPRFTVTVLDDQSTDRTTEVVQDVARRDSRVRLINGTPPPVGWAGKPWACQQLGMRADGDILLFLDADTWLEPQALRYAASTVLWNGYDFLSVMPRQFTGTMAERIVLPGLYEAFLCAVPLWRVEDPDYPEIAAANGQFMCFRRGTYKEFDGHAAVRDQIVEDIEFARQIKQAGYRLGARLAVDSVHCRMYRSGREVLDGFSKNAYIALGERSLVAIGFIVLMLVAYLGPPLKVVRSFIMGDRTVTGLWIPLAQALIPMAIRLTVARRMRFRMADAPFASITALSFIGIVLRSMWWRYRRGGYLWKGRTIHASRLR